MLWKSLASVVIVLLVGGLVFLISLPKPPEEEVIEETEDVMNWRAGEMLLLKEKMNEIQVGPLDLKNAVLEEAIEFLRIQSVENDPDRPERSGVGFVVRGPKVTHEEDEDALGDGLGGDEVGSHATRITLKAGRMGLCDALDLVSEASGYCWKIDPESLKIVIYPEAKQNANEPIPQEIDPDDPFSGASSKERTPDDDPFGQ